MLRKESKPSQDEGLLAIALIIASAVMAVLVLASFFGATPPVETETFVTAGELPAEAHREQVPAAVPGHAAMPLGQRIGEGLVLKARVVGNRIAGYAVDPRSDEEVLAKTRLRAGDVLIQVDDRSLDPGRIQALGQELSLLDRVEITFERGGQSRNRTVDLTRW